VVAIGRDAIAAPHAPPQAVCAQEPGDPMTPHQGSLPTQCGLDAGLT
jgi:hypothetical protein